MNKNSLEYDLVEKMKLLHLRTDDVILLRPNVNVSEPDMSRFQEILKNVSETFKIKILLIPKHIDVFAFRPGGKNKS